MNYRLVAVWELNNTKLARGVDCISLLNCITVHSSSAILPRRRRGRRAAILGWPRRGWGHAVWSWTLHCPIKRKIQLFNERSAHQL